MEYCCVPVIRSSNDRGDHDSHQKKESQNGRHRSQLHLQNEMILWVDQDMWKSVSFGKSCLVLMLQSSCHEHFELFHSKSISLKTVFHIWQILWMEGYLMWNISNYHWESLFQQNLFKVAYSVASIHTCRNWVAINCHWKCNVCSCFTCASFTFLRCILCKRSLI